MQFTEEIKGSINIAASGPSVWAVLSEFYHVDLWAERVRHVERLGDGPPGLGAMRRVDVKGAGKIEETITRWEEGQTLGYQVSPIGPIGASLSLWTIEALDPQKCNVSLQLKYNMRYGWFGHILHAAIVRRRIAGRIRPILSALRHYVETGKMLRADG